jgi:MFS family permease
MKPIKLPEIFKNRNFCLLSLSQFCSNITSAIILFSTINIVFLQLSSASVVAMVTILYYLPGVFLGLFTGPLIDRVDKRKIFIISNLSQALVVILFMAIRQQTFLAFPLVLLYSVFDELFNPAVAAILPNIVKKDDLGSANTVWFFISQGSFALGSVISGIILTLVKNYQWVFPIASFILLIGTLAIFLIPKKAIEKEKKTKLTQEFNLDDFLTDIKDGVTFLRNNKLVLFPILLLALSQVFIGIAISIAPSLAQAINTPIAQTSITIVAPAIFGAIAGGAWVSRAIRHRQFRKKTLIKRGIFLSGAGLVGIFALSFFPIAPKLIWLLIGGVSFSFILMNIPTKTLIQEHSPFEIRGRIYGILNMLVSIGSTLPLLLVASLVDLVGVRIVMLITGLAAIILSLVFNKKEGAILSQIEKQP